MTFENTGILYVDDGSRVADNLWPLVQHLPHRKRLALAGAPDRPNIEDVAEVKSHEIDVKGVVRVMEREHTLWAIMPRPAEDPAVILSDFLSQARPYLEDGYPAFILGLCRNGVRYRTVAVVVDRSQPFKTGSLLGAAVALALRTGASLTVLALGLDEDDLTGNPWVRFNIDHEAEFVDYARTTLKELRIPLNWIALGSPTNRDQAVIEAVREGGYDAVIDDIREVNIGPRIDRLERVRRALAEDPVDTSYRLLRDAHCDVFLVLDAARMDLLHDKNVASGVGAAVLLGALAVGAGAGMQDSGKDISVQGNIESVANPGVADAVAEVQAEAVDEAPPLVETPAPRIIPGPEVLPAEVSQDQLRSAANVVNEARAGLDAESQELAAANAARDATAAAAQAAQAELDAAQNSLENISARRATAERAVERAQATEAGPSQDLQDELDRLNLQKAAVQMRVDAAEQALPAAQEAAELAAAVAAAQQGVTDQVASEVNQMNALYAEAEQRVAIVMPTVNFYISATFGQAGAMWSSGYHTGLDFAAPQGTPLYAIDDGVVIEAGWGGAYGNYTVIQNSDGTTAHYAHQATMGVSVGQHVSAGQQIGTLGSTGNSTGPHLHFEIRDARGNFMDPAPYLGL